MRLIGCGFVGCFYGLCVASFVTTMRVCARASQCGARSCGTERAREHSCSQLWEREAPQGEIAQRHVSIGGSPTNGTQIVVAFVCCKFVDVLTNT